VCLRARANDGAPIYVRLDYMPTYFTPDPQGPDVGYDGTPLMPHTADSLYDGKEYVEQCEGNGVSVYGNIQPEYMVLSDVYGANDVPYDPDKLYVWDIDIEVDRDPVKGFAPVDDPFNPVVSITVKWRHMGQSGVVVYGTQDYTTVGDEFYVKCANEEELLLRFLDDLKAGHDYPDIITGWYVQFFDIPYLVNRMKLLFTESTWCHISPFERLADRKVTLSGRDQTVMDIRGIAILDYMELYRKFTFSQQESYRLDHIAHVELGERKLSYKEFRSLAHLYRENYQKFIEYNIKDVDLVDRLDQKLKLLDLVCALAYGAKCNFADTFKQVRLWDIMIYHRLRALGKQIPPRKASSKSEQYAGAYVKDPLVGEHQWVVSFDVASMYPHIIREWNLSPEMIESRQYVGEWTVDEFLERKPTVDPDYALAANGLQTRRDEEGFLPNMLKTLYDERNRFKGLMKKAKKELEAIKDDPTKESERKALVKQISAYNNQQMVRKVNLNSAYGALGSNYFRFYDLDMAEAVTKTGQLVIRWVARDVNAVLNKYLKTSADYIIASDTDSIYVNMGPFAQKYLNPDHTPKARVVELLDQFAKKIIDPLIAKSLEDIATYHNVAVPCLSMVRDVIADKGVWTAKKRYILNVYDQEGVRYEKPKLKVMGIEAIKSSTPALCRDTIMDVLKLFMTGTREQVWTKVAEARQVFAGAAFEDVAFPRSVNGLAKYSGRDKSIPIHVKGALAFNEQLEKRGQAKEYEPVHEGEKIRFCYLKEPNPFFSHVMSAPEGCPPEWEIEKWIDYDKQYEKSLVEPLEAILSCAGWSAVHSPSLFD
jgi:DNA polymerase elongation subunit (family B)